MEIDRIITMASSGVRIQFLAFERSLRAVGCDRPLLVIPYNDDLFDLPPNAEWWEKAEFTSWLKESQAHPAMAKYVCLTEANYAYFDTDICLIEDCRKILAQQTGFVVADTELIKYGEASTAESTDVLARKTSLWQLRLFNTGHFASDRPLYSVTELESTCAKFKETCLLSPHHEQPGINLLVLVSGVPVTNLCLPPHNMESTMAIDYAYRDDWEETWKQGRRPYFIHYAGGRAYGTGARGVDGRGRENEEAVTPPAEMASADPASQSTREGDRPSILCAAKAVWPLARGDGSALIWLAHSCRAGYIVPKPRIGKSRSRRSIKERPRDSLFLAVGKAPAMSSGNSFSL